LKQYPFLVLIAVAVLVTALFLGSSEEKKILEQLEQIRNLTEIHTAESGMQQATKGRQIGQYFAVQTTFELTSAGYRKYEIASRQELVQRLIRGRMELDTLELALHDPEITVDGDNARVEVQGTALGSMRGEQGQFFESHLIEVMLRKKDGEWLVLAARHIRDDRTDTELLKGKADATRR